MGNNTITPGSPQYRTVSIVSYAVLAVVLLIAGLIWRGEVKGQAARKQQLAEQAQAEQYRAWYERRAQELRWQVGQRAPGGKYADDPWHDTFGKFTGKITKSEFTRWFLRKEGNADYFARLGFSVKDVMELYQEMGLVYK